MAALDREEEERQARTANIRKASAAIGATSDAHSQGGIQGASGRIDCPACGRKKALRYCRAAYHGPLYACCLGTGCVVWIEWDLNTPVP